MRLSEIDILIVPGWKNSGPGAGPAAGTGFGTSSGSDHWQARWLRNMKSARLVGPADWHQPTIGDWSERIVAAVSTGTRPAVIVAYDCGATAVAAAAPQLGQTRLAGAFLVAVPDFDVARHDLWPARQGGFAQVPLHRFPVPTKLIASSTDPYCTVERSQEIGRAWGADVSIIANAGRLDEQAGHGPWPEGLLTFGLFLKSLA